MHQSICTNVDGCKGAGMIDLRVPQFTIGDVSRATGVASETIRSWYKRGILVLGPSDVSAEETGYARRLSGASAIAIGIIGRLAGMGVPLELASRAANGFAFTGADGERAPALLFPEGETLLAIKGDRFLFINANEATLLSDILSASDGSVCLLDLFPIVQGVRDGLKLGPDPLEPVSRRMSRQPRTKRRG
ncbi:MAG: MerR family transcriptional regulator [Rhodopseudomonas palustris]|nr:MAG: MerR family transcriptional regulator [Rhodopseudomonas palustris]